MPKKQKLNDQVAQSILDRLIAGEKPKDLSHEFKISLGLISTIKNHKPPYQHLVHRFKSFSLVKTNRTIAGDVVVKCGQCEQTNQYDSATLSFGVHRYTLLENGNQLQHWLFGTTRCPNCNDKIQIGAAIWNDERCQLVEPMEVIIEQNDKPLTEFSSYLKFYPNLIQQQVPKEKGSLLPYNVAYGTWRD